ncbi:MAG TPA: hypothetical protein VFV38_07055 [Ktedonobacteraceae bacterium]|nr:hypothetical protein [Ktedonobacteraceae bacterium]
MCRWQSYAARTLALYVDWSGEVGQEVAACDEALLAQFTHEKPWGIDLAIDLCSCHPALLSDPAYLRIFVVNLWEKFHLPYEGEPQLVQWNSLEGMEHVQEYALTYLTPRAHLVAHLPRYHEEAYLNFVTREFVCPIQVAVLCQQWFLARQVRLSVIFRERGPRTKPVSLSFAEKNMRTDVSG